MLSLYSEYIWKTMLFGTNDLAVAPCNNCESSQPEVVFEKVVLKNLLKLTGKLQCRSLSLMNFQAGGPGCFSVNFSYFLITLISWNTCEWLLPKLHARKLANYGWFTWINSVITQDSFGKERNKGDIHWCLMGKESNAIWIIFCDPLTFRCDIRYVPPVNLFIMYIVRLIFLC